MRGVLFLGLFQINFYLHVIRISSLKDSIVGFFEDETEIEEILFHIKLLKYALFSHSSRQQAPFLNSVVKNDKQ